MPDFDTRSPQEPNEPNRLRTPPNANKLLNLLFVVAVVVDLLFVVKVVSFGMSIYSSGGAGEQQHTGDARNSKPPTAGGCLGKYRGFLSVDYSPDGQKIVFTSLYSYDAYDSAPSSASGTSADEADDEICVVNADGTGMINLTDDSTDERWAVWSPDGTKIAFVKSSAPNAEGIFVMNADGSNETKLWDSASVGGLTWSPDGQEIAFRANSEIYIMRADGSGTPRALISDPSWQQTSSNSLAWSPDGKWIAFESDGDIYVIQVGDIDQGRQLTDDPANDLNPTWSADGTEIAFDRYYGQSNTRIYKVDSDGSNETKLRGSAYPYGLTWSPDGKHVAYLAEGGLYVVDTDGSNPTLVIADRSE